MILDRLRAGPKAVRSIAGTLYDGAVAQARAPILYGSMGVADTPEGRFEALTLHVILLIDRLNAGGRDCASTGQAVFDIYIRQLDGALREMGVGDLAVGRKMRKLGQAFYGRARAFSDAFSLLPDQALLREVIGRTLLEERLEADPLLLADYVLRCREFMSAYLLDDLLAGSLQWPRP
ncbi:MAG TPA: ubiquinol-cytochrome C chaperone family protein [Caulobacteraceae bacterium]